MQADYGIGESLLNPVTIRDVKLHVVALPLVELLKTSFGAEPYKSAIIVEVISAEGLIGLGRNLREDQADIWR